jgi:hypothetical protein
VPPALALDIFFTESIATQVRIGLYLASHGMQRQPLVSCAYYDGLDIVALASQSKIQILLASNFTRIQILSAHAAAHVTCLQWCNTTGRLASACQDTVVLHQPLKVRDERSKRSKSTHVQWMVFASCKCQSASVLSWPQLGGDSLLAGGNNISIWRPGVPETGVAPQPSVWEIGWSSSTERGCVKAEYSLDSSTFATIQHDDTNVIVWIDQETGDAADFEPYPLQHQHVVQEVQWRHNTSSSQKALFTICVDRLVRIWTQLTSSHEFCTQWVLELKGLSGVNMALPLMGSTLMWVGRQRCNVNEDRIPSIGKNECHERADWLAGIHSNGSLIVCGALLG